MAEDVEHWSSVAGDWIDWVRTPDHDAFWAYRAAFEAFVGPGEELGVDIGAGEGRISRCLTGLGYRMTLCEPVEALLQAARRADSGVGYLLAPGNALPIEREAFDLAVLYNMLMDVEDLDGTVAEALRVLRPDGRLIVGIVHPFADLLLALRRTGAWEGHGGYFGARALDVVAEDGGITMHFRGWSRPLGAYLTAITGAGGVITRVAEPQPDPDHPWAAETRWRQLPLFLWVEARRSRDPATPSV